MSMSKVVVAGYARSPFTPAKKGDLAPVRPDDLAGQVVRALVARAGIPAADIEDLLLGCAFPEGEQGFNLARLVGFLADLPQGIGAATLNRFCGSSMSAVHVAVGSILAGAGDAFICAGVESMSRVPMMGFNPLPNPGLAERMPAAYVSMGETAETVASRHAISRRAQEEFAVESHRRATAARDQGALAAEIVPITGPKGQINADGCIRPDTNLDGLAELKPAFLAEGSVTAGTASPLTDGAAAVLICSEDYAARHGLDVLARVRSFAVSGCAPEVMGLGPIGASRKALQRAGIDANALDVIELNEAFASQALACIGELGLDRAKVNLDGGAIALGHPLGATGARIVGKAAALLRREGGRYALATQCIGGGQGIATVLEAA